MAGFVSRSEALRALVRVGLVGPTVFALILSYDAWWGRDL